MLERLQSSHRLLNERGSARQLLELTAQEDPPALAQQIAVLEELSTTVEIAALISSETPSQSEMDKAIVSYFAIGEASCILPMVRALEFRRAVGGWDPAATAILRSRFFHLQATLTRSFELNEKPKLGLTVSCCV